MSMSLTETNFLVLLSKVQVQYTWLFFVKEKEKHSINIDMYTRRLTKLNVTFIITSERLDLYLVRATV
jgi:hypothetical protein